MRTFATACALVVCLSVSSGAAAESFGSLPLRAEATPLLAGHLTARFPASAAVKPRGHSIMAAGKPSTEETRVVVDLDSQRLVVMTYEVFATAGGQFEAAVRKDVKNFFSSGARYAVRKTPLPPFSQVFVVTPSRLDGAGDANFVLGAYLVHPDGTVQFTAIYANPDASSRDPGGCAALAMSILKSFAPGPRRLEFGPREHALRAYGQALKLKTPAGWTVTTTQGPDFIVHRGRQIRAFGATGSSFGIYIGDHPSLQYAQLGTSAPQTRIPMTVLGTKGAWIDWSDTAGALHREAIIPRKGHKLHLFMAGPDAAAIQQMTHVLVQTTIHPEKP